MFCIESHKVLGSLTQNCLQLDKDKGIVSTFSVVLVDKYAVITTQKSSYVECFNFSQQRFISISYISIKSVLTELVFVYLHFNVVPTIKKKFGYQYIRFIEMERSSVSMRLLLSSWFDKTGIYWVSYMSNNDYSILYKHKRLKHFFFKSINYLRLWSSNFKCITSINCSEWNSCALRQFNNFLFPPSPPPPPPR